MRDISKAALAVGVTGFEPATTWSQTRCATGLRYAPFAPQSYAFFAKYARHGRPRQGNRIKKRGRLTTLELPGSWHTCIFKHSCSCMSIAL